MSEKRFELDRTGIFDNKTNHFYYKIFDEEEVVDLLNELDEKNRELELITEGKLYSRRDLEKENKQLYKKLIEQQDFINLLFEELLDAQRQGYVVNFTHKNKPCSIIPKELGE